MFILSVKELFSSIKIKLESTFPFVLVKGAVVNLSICSRGNLYFSLIEGSTSINCICWKAKFDKLKIHPQKNNIENQELIIKGYIKVYQSSTKVSLIVIDIIAKREATNYLLLEKRESKLREAGYFDPENKKPLPSWPNIIGIITSQESRAKEDFITAISKRLSPKILVYNSSVQGNQATTDLINAIKYFNNMKTHLKPKVILITRGGGSYEDLETFNEEILVKSIFNSNIPIITAIGHTKDISLADYAADSYAITPTAAAEIIVPITTLEYKNKIKHYLNSLKYHLKNKYQTCYSAQQLLNTRLLNPKEYIKEQSYYLNKYQSHLITILKQNYHKSLINLKKLETQLNLNAQTLIKGKSYLLKTIKIQSTNIMEYLSKQHKAIFLLYYSLKNQFNTYLHHQNHEVKLHQLQFTSALPNFNAHQNNLLYFTKTLNKEANLKLKEISTNYYYLNKMLNSLSYVNTLKRGFAIIKDPKTNTIIKKSSDLKDINTFEIIFHDNTIKIIKK